MLGKIKWTKSDDRLKGNECLVTASPEGDKKEREELTLSGSGEPENHYSI